MEAYNWFPPPSDLAAVDRLLARSTRLRQQVMRRYGLPRREWLLTIAAEAATVIELSRDLAAYSRQRAAETWSMASTGRWQPPRAR